MPGTLLGPEETGAGAPGSSVRPACPAVRMPTGRAWFRLLLENCIVDASIFCKSVAFFCLGIRFVCVKFLRAHGGCLGTRSRRRTWEAAKSLGELPTKL